MKPGRVITFYSYKGGVGRTFVLANVAAILAQWGAKVLCIDWDLEAPGLHHFIKPNEAPKDAPSLLHLLESVSKPPTSSLRPDREEWKSYVRTARIGDSDSVDIITAGEDAPDYAARMQQLDWQKMYEKHAFGEWLQRLRQEWTREYEFVLIDSRTGLTDIGGVCTVHLPDIVVCVFTANRQNLAGTESMARRINEKRQEFFFGSGRAMIMPLLSRWEEKDAPDDAKEWLPKVLETLRPSYDQWREEQASVERLAELLKIPYKAKWNFGERLAVLEESATDPGSVSYHLHIVAAVLARDFADSYLLTLSPDRYVAEASGNASRTNRPVQFVERPAARPVQNDESAQPRSAGAGHFASPHRLAFSDPLYENVDLASVEALARRYGASASFQLGSIVGSPEFLRQGSLQQSGLKSNVFLSSTHTRLAHAIGVGHLGKCAMESTYVLDQTSAPDRRMLLCDFLDRHSLVTEFLLALILHDVGHFPFSHVLEGNAGIRQILGAVLSHEEATCQLIRGEGLMHQGMDRVVERFPSTVRDAMDRLHETVRRATNGEPWRLDALCYLISGDQDSRTRAAAEPADTRRLAALDVVHALVSGLLDLDRIDHYRRDSYFNGVWEGTGLRYEKLLAGVTVTYSPDRPRQNAELLLSAGAFSQAIRMLDLRKALRETVFEHPDVLAYEAMLNEAVRLHVTGLNKNQVADLLLLTDDILLAQLAASPESAVASLATAIACRQPYDLVAKFACPSIPEKITSAGQVIDHAENIFGRGKHLDMAFKFTAEFTKALEANVSRVAVPSDDWFKLGRIHSVDNAGLVSRKLVGPESASLGKTLDELRERENQREPAVWVFMRAGRNVADIDEAATQFAEFLDATICWVPQ